MKITHLFVAVSFAWLLVSFWNRNDLPGNIDYVPEITTEPKQTKTSKRPFDVFFKDVEYLIEPEFEYDLTGMIVSFRHHDSNSRMHLQANDHLNMLDVCNVKTRDQVAWDAFDMNQLSNNHLISDDEFI